MNVYERILNILLEARVDMFIQDRLDESRVDELNKATMKRALKKAQGEVEGAHAAHDTAERTGSRVPRIGSSSGPTAPSQAVNRRQGLIRKTQGRLKGDTAQRSRDIARAQHRASSEGDAGREARIAKRAGERRATEIVKGMPKA